MRINRTILQGDRPTKKATNIGSNKNTFWKLLIVLWMVFIILSQVPFLAENFVDTSEMDDVMEYHLSFPQDGKAGHYYVERYNQSQIGRINVKYTTKSNSLEVLCHCMT